MNPVLLGPISMLACVSLDAGARCGRGISVYSCAGVPADRRCTGHGVSSRWHRLLRTLGLVVEPTLLGSISLLSRVLSESRYKVWAWCLRAVLVSSAGGHATPSGMGCANVEVREWRFMPHVLEPMHELAEACVENIVRRVSSAAMFVEATRVLGEGAAFGAVLNPMCELLRQVSRHFCFHSNYKDRAALALIKASSANTLRSQNPRQQSSTRD
ncbi:hypothetical protein GH714_006572 [Hevea brasiliensis]|uniref:Uncharacterized protein n=1 Tax=Hevea brasiliensis TaxID=3981 RepID=A0A6A6M8V0_HEVBR|nr:hypothetical protein GH714_006572 [Hevea brasiliensis]